MTPATKAQINGTMPLKPCRGMAAIGPAKRKALDKEHNAIQALVGLLVRVK